MDNKKLETTEVENNQLKENATVIPPTPIINYVSPSTSKGKKIWDFLNSSIFIWFLSSVIVVIVTNWFNNMKVSNESDAKKIETIRKLENEISYRIYYSIRYLTLRKVGHDSITTAENIYLDIYNILDNRKYSQNNGDSQINFALNEAYFKKPFGSLLFELKSIDTSLNNEIKNAFVGFNELDNIASLKRFEKQTTQKAVDTSIEIFQQKFLGRRWTKYFVDDPFMIQ